MNRTLARIRQVTEELKAIQMDLFETGVSKDGQSPAFLDDPYCLEILSAFKARVDDLRRLLFFFVNRLTKEAGHDQNKTIHEYRLRRAAELLEVLSRPPILVLSKQETAMLSNALEKFLSTYKKEPPPPER